MLLRLKNFLRRPVAWGAVLLSYAGVIAAVAYAAAVGADNSAAVRAEAIRADARIGQVIQANAAQSRKTERGLCRVVIDVHEASKERYQNDRRSLRTTRAYLNDVQGDNSPLARRIRQGLPALERRVQTSKRSANATKPPAACNRYRR